MDIFNALVSPSNHNDPDDALKVLGRVADAFDNPSLHRTDKELLFVVNVVKSRHLLPSLSSDESALKDTTYGSNNSSFNTSYDEDVELVELGDVAIWEHTTSYPYTSRRSQFQQPRSFSDRIFCEDDAITKMLLTSSPLDRLDRLARMELKKTGWVERADKWTVVEMGLQKAPPPKTPPKTPSKRAGCHVNENQQHSSSPLRSATMMSPKSEKQAPCSPPRTQTRGGQTGEGEQDHMLERNRCQGSTIKSGTPRSIRSPVLSQESDSYMIDFSPPYSDASRLSHTSLITPIRTSRFSRALVHPQTQQQTGGRLGQVVRNFVKRMLPPSSGGGASPRGTSSYSRPRTGNKGSSSTRTCQAGMTPRSDISGESAWTLASEGTGQGCLDYHAASSRWSGLWH